MSKVDTFITKGKTHKKLAEILFNACAGTLEHIMSEEAGDE